MPSSSLVLLALASSFALVSLGGGAYEALVIDPAWPTRPELIQPARGGVTRRTFWMPAHGAFELCFVAVLVLSGSLPHVRTWLLVALGSHLIMRVWSFADFIPKALAFERAEPGGVGAAEGQRWCRRSRVRLVLDVVTCGALMAALIRTAQLG